MAKKPRLLLLILLAAFAQVHAQNKIDTSARIDALIKKMTLQEKVNMIHSSSSFTSGGVPRLGIPEMVTSDGPHGVRPEHGRDWELDNNSLDSGTYLPVGVCLAATWNPRLGYEYGKVLGSEANYRGKDVILGPGINIIRTPLNGRNFEYQSEDPYLVSKMVVGYIRGVQDQGISACVKHYAANNQEAKRFTVNVEMSERALREIYLPGFKAAVQIGGANTLMSSYNKFRGQWASQNNYLLNQILKKEWGFKGLVMSDWDAVHSTMQALWNGMDLEMGTDLHMLPNPDYTKFFLGDTVVSLVNAGRFPEYLLDDKVRRILYVMYKTKMIDGTRKKGAYNTKAHQQTAHKVAEEGIVLLKNQNNLLPLNKEKTRTIAVIGLNAQRKQSMGGGSSQVRAFYEVTPLEGLQRNGGNIRINYAQGYNIARDAKADASLIRQAVDAASKADVVVYVGGTTHGYNYSVWKDNAYDAEDTDKPNMLLPFGQDELLQAVLKANPKTVVVLMGGGAVDMQQWINQAPAILQAWYPGLEGGNALAKIIFGDINPSGKLPMTFPKQLEDHGSHKLGEYPGDKDTANVHYMDDIYVGYRYYDTYKVEPQFAFGHGLSYTIFQYSNLKVTGSKGKATVSFTIRNNGKVAGAEVAQVYVSQASSALPRPEKELKGFEKVFLRPGEHKTISISLDEDAFKYFNDVKNAWVMEPGIFRIGVGGSSRDIKLKGEVRL
ncbi:glycoside hydrolase family 3 C-terminal domain-containing protein [Aridibaculum aurantiacum]|uniref:glycoside hydrolase family 3 C-terminal domain-containing protein n=1 Tax=Aridibaculum aurantiacum TaxID=2810307 RepID=UPI001A96BD5B|nr:glycoside hydrolase family 3 C-terminal domain-containing protein [Aridibaculum aurantiacum]